METARLGGDILAERLVSGEELRTALSTLLSVSPETIIVYEDWQELPQEPDRTKLYCRRWHPQGGEFRTVIDLPDSLLKSLPRDSTATALAKLLTCRLLVDDGSVNPFTFLLYDGEGRCQHVAVDVDASDKNEFLLQRQMEATCELNTPR